ncbi:NAD-dependent epimerase/dehydratase family protein [Kitasatospora sp. MAP5-34]|uniref:NAD-dependent epimerase/dehydratase family protein n=1 Tax=Kitasatospora sp. MAP5-34 TaxID=3035102 RepID=UPI0024744139|nr:NAD-dependent epimerase/dehydratase family protein [Kitasatospora sp. MAP5-34]MDH6576714.1 2'-hydroxyisoflavone reductase [Kitasatospora sp. MAP5-34]
MNILILGGSAFLGRAYVSEALRRGHHVTTFNRGLSGADQPGVEAVRGDRNLPAGLDRLIADRRWDAVVDTAGQQPYAVGLAARLLRPHTDHYTLVSSIHAFADWGKLPLDENSTTHPCPADTPPDQPPGNHLKAGCERALLESFGADRSLILNCGLLIGPHENIGRLPWWLERIARGGKVLAPGAPSRAMQLIDARDFAAFGLDLLEQGRTGRFITTAPPGSTTFGELLDACVQATGAAAEPVWTDEEVLLSAGVEPWTELPIWAPDRPDWDAIWLADSSRARAAGLRCRPLSETVRDTWAWLQERGPAAQPYLQGRTPLGIDPEKERSLLAKAAG